MNISCNAGGKQISTISCGQETINYHLSIIPPPPRTPMTRTHYWYPPPTGPYTHTHTHTHTHTYHCRCVQITVYNINHTHMCEYIKHVKAGGKQISTISHTHTPCQISKTCHITITTRTYHCRCVQWGPIYQEIFGYRQVGTCTHTHTHTHEYICFLIR